MLTALVAVGGALAGLLFGSVLDRWAERRKWLRDARFKADVDYVTVHQAMRQILRERAVWPPGTPEHRRAMDALRTHWPLYSTSVAALELYGKPEVFNAVQEVDGHVRNLSAAISNEDFDNARWHEARVPMDESMRKCIDAIRSDLGLERLQSRDAWVLRSPSLNERLPVDPPAE